MEQVGVIRKTVGDKVEVEVKRFSGCGGSCSSCSSSCSAETSTLTVRINNHIGAKVGDLVEIKAKPKKILKYTFIIYMIPFFMLVMGIFIGVNYFKAIDKSNYEILGFGVGMVFLAMSFLVIRLVDRYINKKEGNLLEITRIIK